MIQVFNFTYIIPSLMFVIAVKPIAAIIAAIIATGTMKWWKIILFDFAAFHFNIYSLNYLKLVDLCYYSHR